MVSGQTSVVFVGFSKFLATCKKNVENFQRNAEILNSS